MTAGSPQALIAFAVATTVAIVAALGAPALFGRRGTASRVVVASLTWNVVTTVPVFLLGFTNLLYGAALAAVVSTLSVSLLAFEIRSLGMRTWLLEVAASFAAFVTAPFRAIRVAWEEGSFAAFAVPIAGGLWLWLLVQTALEGTFGDPECLALHEPQLALAIQRHGFSPAALDPAMAVLNAQPRGMAAAMTFIAMFHGRWAADLVNVLSLPMLAGGSYALGRSLGVPRGVSVGLAAVLLTLPAVVRMTPTMLPEPHAAALLVAGAWLLTTRALDRRTAVLAATSVALAMTCGLTHAVPAVALGLALAVRAGRGEHTRAQGLATAAYTLVPNLVAIASTVVPNLIRFGNPLGPTWAVSIPALRIAWPGALPFEGSFVPPELRVPRGVNEAFVRGIARPDTVLEGSGWQIVDYGYGLVWLVLPITAFLVVLTLARGASESSARTHVPVPTGARMAALLGLLALVTVALTPYPLHVGRMYLGVLPLLFAVAGHALARRGARPLAEALVGVALLSNATTLAWSDRTFIVTPSRMADMWTTKAPARWHDPRFRSAIRPEAAVVRERASARGDVIGFDGVRYAGILWNDHYSNRVVWLGPTTQPLRAMRRVGATLAYASLGGPIDVAASEPTSGLTRLGPYDVESSGVLYRRR